MCSMVRTTRTPLAIRSAAWRAWTGCPTACAAAYAAGMRWGSSTSASALSLGRRAQHAALKKSAAMPFAGFRRIEYRLDLGAQELLIVRIVHEPAQRRRIGMDHHEVLFQAIDEELPGRAAVARQRGIADEIPAFAAFGRAVLFGRCAGGQQKRQGKDRTSHGGVDYSHSSGVHK